MRAYLEKLLASFGPPQSVPGRPAEPDRAIDALTRKELQVLQLAADGFSNSAMVERLKTSDSTVRTHLRSINSKVGARSRTEAVAIARRLGVIR